MAKLETVELVDDLVGGTADETVEFALDGKGYEVDLNAHNAGRLRESLAEFIGAGRKAAPASTGRKARPSGGRNTAAERAENRAAREWARANGFTVTERGRIPADALDAYRNRPGA